MSRSVAKVASGRAEFEAEIIDVRERITALKDEIDDLASSPVTVEEALGRLDAIIPGVGAAGEPEIGYFFAPERGPSAIDIGIADSCNQGNGVAFLQWLLRDLIRERLAAEIQQRGLELGVGVSRADRATKLHKLKISLRNAEAEEETIIRAAEAEGMRPARRPDADPEVVLAKVS